MNIRKDIKKIKKDVKGITLIALVVTIIVLLILAGIALNLTIGQNGIFSRAQDAANTWRNAEANEQLAMNNLASWIDAYFPAQGNTLGQVYADSMIGQSINYSANGQDDWIILGKDSNGNILITTSEPVTDVTYTFKEDGVEGWAKYEEDINTLCSVYKGTVQGEEVEARSITIEDINYAVGFVNPGPEFEEYTFGNEYNLDENKVNYWYPVNDASKNYKIDPKTEGEPSATFFSGEYYYAYSSGKYYYLGTNLGDEGLVELSDANFTRKENMKYILGDIETEQNLYAYVVASSSVSVSSETAEFGIGAVAGNGVGFGLEFYCTSNANGISNGNIDSRQTFSVRPVVVLPPELQVEKQKDGTYLLA